MAEHKLKSGQINFESQEHSGSYACVVIMDGEFYNLTDDLRKQIIDALSTPNGPNAISTEGKRPNAVQTETTNLEDMF